VARPYICLLIILMRLALPSTVPELCRRSSARVSRAYRHPARWAGLRALGQQLFDATGSREAPEDFLDQLNIDMSIDETMVAMQDTANIPQQCPNGLTKLTRQLGARRDVAAQR
jgi:hypothetical protein